MASNTIRKAIGVLKDQTSISIAKVAGNVAPDLEILVVKATSHDDEPPDEKCIGEILNLTSNSEKYAGAFVLAISKRLYKTHDWIVAVKSLMLIHRLLSDGSTRVGKEVMRARWKGARVLNMSDFQDVANAKSLDHAAFVRSYALYLDQKFMFITFKRKLLGAYKRKEFNESTYDMNPSSISSGDSRESVKKNSNKEGTPHREMMPEKVLRRLYQLLYLLDRTTSCRPYEYAETSRIVLGAVYLIVKESLTIYINIRELLRILMDRFMEMAYADCQKVYDAYVQAARIIDELEGFYSWCKDKGIVRSSEYPQVKKITPDLLETLKGLLDGRANKHENLEKIRVDSSTIIKHNSSINMKDLKPLPPPLQDPQSKMATQQVTEDLVNFKLASVSAEVEGNKLAATLFSESPAANENGSSELFPSNGEPEVTSVWQTPAAESGKADWVSALVDTATNVSKQTPVMGGGFDALLLNGMYEQGAVMQHRSNANNHGGCASSVTLPGLGKSAASVLALPAADRKMQMAEQDPFAPSLEVPLSLYVQRAEIEKQQQQQLLVLEQQVLQQYGINGMHGQAGLTETGGAT